MKRLLFLISGILLMIASCDNSNNTDADKKEEQLSETNVLTSVNYEMTRIFVKDTNCKSDLKDCAHVLIIYPKFLNKHLSKINMFINHRMADLFGYGDVENPDLVNLSSAADSTIADYQKFKKEFPESKQVWSFRLKARVSFVDDEKISILIVSDSYMGGAHGNVNQMFMNFDKKGNLLKLENIVEDIDLFKEIAEKKFRLKKNIKKGESYSDAGFNFPNDEFALPANIGLSDTSFILYYNQYEIAPYSMGPTQLLIDFDELK